MYENVKIKMTGPGRGEIYIDGKKLENVKSFSLSAAVMGATELTVSFYIKTVEYEGPVCEVMLDNGEESHKIDRGRACKSS